MAILESMASGVPLISSKVGMAEDIIKHQQNGFICDIGDKTAYLNYVKELTTQKKKKEAIIQAGLTTAQSYTWKKIAGRYEKELYKPLLSR